MKRPPGLWLLLITVFVWLCIEEVYSVKATSLIFGKTTTTTTSSSNAAESERAEEIVTEANINATTGENQNSTKPLLTGIPQIDYIYDPNLPRELNGYNLSEYPFYDRVPEDIVFKCDGLHDGFYASVPHKCQVYHHCLFGTRFDFLCANYTAFDQKTFICHFVSEVDCVNSKKFWHRNDALYQAASTTTPKPIVYTQPPAPATSVPIVPLLPRRPMGGGRRRRPQRRRRPEYEYYDYEEDEDYYEEPRRRKRPRYRPRPVYDDEYDDYEEDSYNRRRPGHRDEDRERRPYNRRGSDDRRRNNGDRRKYDDEEYEYDARGDDDRKKRPNNDRREKRPSTKRRPAEDIAADDDDYDARSQDRPRKGHRRPVDEEYEDVKPLKEDRRSYNRPRKSEDRRPYDKPKKNDEEGRRSDERPAKNDEENRRPYDEGRRSYDRPRKGNDNEGSRKYDKPRKADEGDNVNYDDKAEEDKVLIKPSGSSVYARPRTPPRIRPPVPKNEQDKYSYKAMVMKSSTAPPADEEYYDEYEEETSTKTNKKPEAETRRPPKTNRDDSRDGSGDPSKDNRRDKDSRDTNGDARDNRNPANSRRGQPNRRPDDEYSEDETVTRRPNKRPKYEAEQAKDRRVGSAIRKRPVTDDRQEQENNSQPPQSDDVKLASTTAVNRERPEPVVKVVKRPFLPSRGGNPYTPRGLQPVGAKAPNASSTTEDAATVDATEAQKMMESRKPEDTKSLPDVSETSARHDQDSRVKVIKVDRGRDTYNTKQNETPLIKDGEDVKSFKPSPIVVKIPIRTKYLTTNEEEFRPISNRPLVITRQSTKVKETQPNEMRTTEKPKPAEINPLDIDESEYDVTLNDALNPTLPNLPVRGFPTGFSAPNDYAYSAYQRSRYVVDPALNQASTDYVYRIKQPEQNYNSGGNQFANAEAAKLRFNAPPVYQNFRQTPRVTQAQTQPFYSTAY